MLFVYTEQCAGMSIIRLKFSAVWYLFAVMVVMVIIAAAALIICVTVVFIGLSLIHI